VLGDTRTPYVVRKSNWVAKAASGGLHPEVLDESHIRQLGLQTDPCPVERIDARLTVDEGHDILQNPSAVFPHHMKHIPNCNRFPAMGCQ
jgi:hypothetical protein